MGFQTTWSQIAKHGGDFVIWDSPGATQLVPAGGKLDVRDADIDHFRIASKHGQLERLNPLICGRFQRTP